MKPEHKGQEKNVLERSFPKRGLPSTVTTPNDMDSALTDRVRSLTARTTRGLERRMTELQKAEICQRVREAREAAGLTQRELADRLHVVEKTVSNYERIRAPLRRLAEIAEILGRTHEWLLFGEQGGVTPLDADAGATEEGKLLVTVVQDLNQAVMQTAEAASANSERLDELERQTQRIEGGILDVQTRLSAIELLLQTLARRSG